MSAPLLSVRDLRIDYAATLAVDGLSFDVHAGEALALLGPNGAGKTSTMRAIAGVLEPTLGAIRVGGHDRATARAEVNRRVGFMPDVAPLYPKLTCREFLEHYGLASGVAALDARIDACLAMTELSDKADAPCGSLSRGMKQRLILARCLLPDPSVLLLDEPASGLDPLSRRGLQQLIRMLRDQGKAILISSHILGEMDGFCTHALVLERGRRCVFGRIDALASAGGARRHRVAWHPDDAHAVDRLAATPGVTILERLPDGAVFHIRGPIDGLDALLRALLAAHVRIRLWAPADNALEHILLQSGAKELQ